MLGSNSQLKYGARLINSYLGDNSTISCCEVLNSLIFPAHEQHHNNSFLCAALVMGQSNMAAGATIGSNHNSRGADGEIIAGRGFWPGLCVSLKHNSKFASFTLIAKSDYPCELNIPIPFSLVSNDLSRDMLTIMPGYWFLYNMYALARNASKYIARDKRIDKTQEIEYDFLAPDSVNELFDALYLLKQFTGKAYARQHKGKLSEKELLKKGEALLENDPAAVSKMEILAEGFENSLRKVQILKTAEAYRVFKELVIYYGVSQLIGWIERHQVASWQKLISGLPGKPVRNAWKNTGGQLMPDSAVNSLIRNIRSGKIKDWDQVHVFYQEKSRQYADEKTRHAYASLLELLKLSPGKFTKKIFARLLQQAVATREWMVGNIYDSRAKDYSNPFRQMVYDNPKEMEKVTGKLSENGFIREQREELEKFRRQVKEIAARFAL